MASIYQLSAFLVLAGLASAAPHSKLHKREALPDYAITYAPLTYLYSEEKWFPSDIKTHLQNVQSEVNYVASGTSGTSGSVTLDTLSTYASDVYLTA